MSKNKEKQEGENKRHKYLLYLKYLIKHKWFVLLECFKLGVYWRGIAHDFSKFRPSEFFPYANFFYGNYPEELNIFEKTYFYNFPTKQIIKRHFNVAWNHHQKRNKHHWQYWLLKNDDGEQFPVGMPEKYLKEMLADWRGAGRAIHGKDETKSWYLKNRDKIILNLNNRCWIESELGVKGRFVTSLHT